MSYGFALKSTMMVELGGSRRLSGGKMGGLSGRLDGGRMSDGRMSGRRLMGECLMTVFFEAMFVISGLLNLVVRIKDL